MTAGSPARPARSQPRRELALLLLLGAAGAGLALLATRQGWARVETAAPRPLPASVTTVTGQALVPAAGALALAALAGLAAVLATRRALRRIAGVLVAGLGAGLALAVGAGISPADVLAAAAAGAPGGSGAAAGSGVGSTTAGSGRARPGGIAAVRPFRARGLRELSLARDRLRRGTRGRRGRGAGGVAGGAAAGDVQPVRPAVPARRPEPAEPAVPAGGRGYQGDSAAMWESLSRGEDPTGPE